MTFQSFTPGAFLSKVSVYEDLYGHIFAALTCQDACIQTFRCYLITMGVLQESACFKGVFYARKRRELDWTLNFLLRHNTFADNQARELLIRLLKRKSLSQAPGAIESIAIGTGDKASEPDKASETNKVGETNQTDETAGTADTAEIYPDQAESMSAPPPSAASAYVGFANFDINSLRRRSVRKLSDEVKN